MNFIKLLVLLVVIIFIARNCNDDLPNGYFYDSGFNWDIPGDWLYKSQGGYRVTVMDTLIIQQRHIDDYFVGVGLPAKVEHYNCYDSNDKVQGEGGFIHTIKDELDFFIFNLKNGTQEHFPTSKDMYIKTDKLGLKLKPFDQEYIKEFRIGLLANGHVNRTPGRGCKITGRVK